MDKHSKISIFLYRSLNILHNFSWRPFFLLLILDFESPKVVNVASSNTTQVCDKRVITSGYQKSNMYTYKHQQITMKMGQYQQPLATMPATKEVKKQDQKIK